MVKKELRRREGVRRARSNWLKYKNLVHSIPANVRFMVKRDFKQIAIIERDSFEYPWLPRDFCLYLRRRNVVCYVAEHNGFVVAYTVIKYYRKHIEICNLAVARQFRRQKIASLIINMLKIKLQLECRNYISAYVSDRNLFVHLFLRKNKFIAEQVLRDYYAKGHDAYHMVFNPVEQKLIRFKESTNASSKSSPTTSSSHRQAR